MELELVTIGNELLLGLTVDTNAAELSRAFTEAGFIVAQTTTVPDLPNPIADAVTRGLARTGFVVTTGGLGPTRDDVTKRAVSAIFDAELVLDAEYLEQLRLRFEQMGRGPMPESNRSQAEVPEGALVLPNRRGTAPGLWLEGAPGTVVMLPGVPREARGLVRDELLPRLQERVGGDRRVTQSVVLRTTGVSESALADRLQGTGEQIHPLTLAFLPSPEGVDLRLTAWQSLPAEAARRLEAARDLIVPQLGQWHYGDGDLAALVLDQLRAEGATLAVAESCTGGLVAERITAIPGASEVFVGGIIAYADWIKSDMLGVTPDVIARQGAVSEPTVREMVVGCIKRFGADAGIGVTGIAGPAGGTEAKPVGTVFIAASYRGREATRRLQLPGGRWEVRRRSAQAAINLLRGLIDEAPESSAPSG